MALRHMQILLTDLPMQKVAVQGSSAIDAHRRRPSGLRSIVRCVTTTSRCLPK